MAKRRRRKWGGAPPAAIDERTHAAGLRAVAVFEAVKGTAVLALALGLLTLLHRDLEQIADNLLTHLHIDAEHKLGRVIMHAASTTTDRKLVALACAAMAYTTVRFVEAWGLWHRRVWAEWFALLSGCLYLPYEILKLSEHTGWLSLTVFVTNVAIVLYMLYIRITACRAPKECAEEEVLSA